jgi:hypothetical protein
VDIGMPSIEIPITMLPKLAVGLPFASLFRAVVMLITPVIHMGPATKSPKQATGSPLTIVVMPPGPIITSPVAVKLQIEATGVGISYSLFSMIINV